MVAHREHSPGRVCRKWTISLHVSGSGSSPLRGRRGPGLASRGPHGRGTQGTRVTAPCLPVPASHPCTRALGGRERGGGPSGCGTDTRDSGSPGLGGQAATPTSAPGHGCKGSPHAVPAARALTFADGPLRPGCKCCRRADSLRTRSGGRGAPLSSSPAAPAPHTPPAPWGPPGEDSVEPAQPAHDGAVCPTRRPRSLRASPASGTSSRRRTPTWRTPVQAGTSHQSRTPRQTSAGTRPAPGGSDQGSPAGDAPCVHTARGTVLTANTAPARPGGVGQPVSRSPPATAGTGK
nr:uncharacterized protein LOC112934411 [Vulpes vulpes]